MPIIEVDRVTKEFRLGQLLSLRQSVRNGWAHLTGGQTVKRQPFKALDDVCLTVEPGEVVGIIGHNGAGKSTLLKLLAGISAPTRGKVVVRGQVAPLIEVGAGLVPDLTGRENIFLNAAILGLRKRDIRRKLDEIVSFAELEEFIDTPVKRYSSGMKAKLGISIATSVEASILIVDEVLAVGDLAFQRKCIDRLEDLIKRRGNTVLIVSHNIRQIERMCSRVVLLNRGRILRDGSAVDVCQAYYQQSDERIAQVAVEAAQTARGWRASGEVELDSVILYDGKGRRVTRARYGADLVIGLRYRVHAKLLRPVFSVGIHTTDFFYLATQDSQEGLPIEELAPGSYELRFWIRRFPFLPGVYSIRTRVGTGEFDSAAFSAENILHFQVDPGAGKHVGTMGDGFVSLDAAWDVAPIAREPTPSSIHAPASVP